MWNMFFFSKAHARELWIFKNEVSDTSASLIRFKKNIFKSTVGRRWRHILLNFLDIVCVSNSCRMSFMVPPSPCNYFRSTWPYATCSSSMLQSSPPPRRREEKNCFFLSSQSKTIASRLKEKKMAFHKLIPYVFLMAFWRLHPRIYIYIYISFYLN